MTPFDELGFRWDREAVPNQFPPPNIERAIFRFRKLLSQFVWDASALEGNPFTFPEVQTLLEGVTVGGRKLSDQEQVLNLAESSRRLIEKVRTRTFELDKPTFCELHGIVARNEALESGHFRGEGQETRFTPPVALGEHGQFMPPATQPNAPELNQIFADGVSALNSSVPSPFERALAFFLFGALRQFFFDGNKRTARLMMNGVLMSNGIDALSVPAVRAQEFNTKMVAFYLNKDATEMMAFLLDCHPEAEAVRKLNSLS